LALAYLAGRKTEQAIPLLDRLVSQGNSSAMLASPLSHRRLARRI
jgi:hypothetical protein